MIFNAATCVSLIQVSIPEQATGAVILWACRGAGNIQCLAFHCLSESYITISARVRADLKSDICCLEGSVLQIRKRRSTNTHAYDTVQ